MKCLSCGMEVDEKFNICPNCGSVIKKKDTSVLDDIDLELPILKEDAKKLDEKDMLDSLSSKFDNEEDLEEKTGIIEPIREDELSFVDEINRQTELVNNEEYESNEDSDSLLDLNQPIEENINNEFNIEVSEEESMEEKKGSSFISLESPESVKKRTNILIITGIISLVVLAFLGITIKLFSGNNSKPKEDGYSEILEKALNTYYETEKVDDIIYILEDYKKDNEVILDIQDKVKEKSDSWLNIYSETEYSASEEFENQTAKYRSLIRGLYEYANVKEDNAYIRALSDSDFNEVNQRLEDLYNDYKIYYEAIDLYNKKDYDKSYYMLEQIDDENSCYVNARLYMDRIMSNVVGIMKLDISNIEETTLNMTNKEKLEVYSQIEKIIKDYNEIYSNLDLSKNGEYSNLLTTYQDKVSAYTEKISKGLGNQTE